MSLGEVIPNNLLVASWYLSWTIVHGGIPLHLFPGTLYSTGLNESQRNPATRVSAVAVSIAVKDSGVSGVTEDASANCERNWGMRQSVAENASLPIGRIVDLVVDE